MANNKKNDALNLLEFAKCSGDTEFTAMAEMAVKLSEVVNKYRLDSLHTTSVLARLSAAYFLGAESDFKKTGCPAPIEYFFMDILTECLDFMREENRKDARKENGSKMN